MSPAKKTTASNNLYTAILALSLAISLATAVFITAKCWIDYGTILKIVEVSR